MFLKKFFTTLLFAGVLMATAACGQLSVGVITTEEVTPADIVEVVATTEPATPEPEVSPEASAEPEEVPEMGPIPTFVYVGSDGNLWLLESGSESPRQLTTDANDFGSQGTAVQYDLPALSSDGTMLAYRKDVGIPSQNDGYETSSGLYVRNLLSAEETLVLEGYSAGWAWKPGGHILAYGIAADMEYFLNRGEPDPEKANGIFTIDLDSGEVVELVAPERGLTLAQPQWSPDGRFLAFSEVKYMEGSGDFAYYDLSTASYYSLEEPLGTFSWSPNGGLLTYARQTYTATGEERLYLRERDGQEQAIGLDYEGPAYATAPEFSPDGSKIAYLAFLEGPDVNIAEVTVLDLASGETSTYGKYQEAWKLVWTPDGSHLVFYSGPWDSPKIMAVNLLDGSQTVLAEGRMPALAGQ